MSESDERVRIGFTDDEGDTEAIWGSPLDGNKYRLEGNPFFAYGVSVGDTVEAKEEDGLLRFVKVVEKSGNRTIRVFTSEGEDSTNQFFKKIGKLGCRYEGLNARMFAVIVPESVDMKTLTDFLRKSDLEWEYADPTLAEVKKQLEAEAAEAAKLKEAEAEAALNALDEEPDLDLDLPDLDPGPEPEDDAGEEKTGGEAP